MVPLNFPPRGAGFSSVPHETHLVAVSVLGLPQFGQKTVTRSPLLFAQKPLAKPGVP